MNLVQFGVWRDGAPAIFTEEVRMAFEAVGQTVGVITPEDRDGGVWVVEVDDSLVAELTTEGFISLEHGPWHIEAEMP